MPAGVKGRTAKVAGDATTVVRAIGGVGVDGGGAATVSVVEGDDGCAVGVASGASIAGASGSVVVAGAVVLVVESTATTSAEAAVAGAITERATTSVSPAANLIP
jgi:hypothetical protein